MRAFISTLFIVGSLLLYSLNAKTATIDSSSWNVSFLKVDDGLPDSTVFSIQQDPTGYLWFGTTQGVARYDGYNFHILNNQKDNPNSISSNNAGNLFIDSQNQLWVGTFGGGLNVVDLTSNSIKRYSYIGNDPNKSTISANVQTLFEDHKSRIWVGTDSGLYLITGHQIKHFAHNPNVSESISHPRVWDVIQTKDNKTWIGTSNGLSSFNEKNNTFTNYSLPSELQIDGLFDEFRTLYADNNGAIWIGASSGLFRFDLESKIFKYFTPFHHSLKINKIAAFDNNKLFVATLDGLFNFDIENQEFNLDEESNVWHKFVGNDIRDIHQDDSGLLWLSTRYGGVIKIDLTGSPFKYHSNSNVNNTSFQSKRINAIEMDSQGNLYIGSDETVYKITANGDFYTIGFAEKESIPGNIQSIHQSSQNNGVWIGSTKGLYFLSESDNKAIAITEPFDLVNMEPTNVFSIEETSSGDLWMGLFNKGLLYWDPKLNKSELNLQNKTSLLTNLSIITTLEDSQQNIWFGSRLGGLFRYNPQTKDINSYTNNPTNSNTISSNLIRDIYQDSSNNLWIATSKGLNLFNEDQESFTRISSNEGLLGDSIQSIVEDKQQTLWLGTQYGMSQWDKDTKQSQNFGLNKNLNNDALVAQSVLVDNKGKIYFGSNNGFYTLDPKNRSQQEIFEPQLVITDIKVNHQPIAFTTDTRIIEFNHLDRLISIEFASLDFKAPKQNHYKYRILEINENWITDNNSRTLKLNNFAPGTYNIEIMGTNSNGQWSPHQLKLLINIIPAWWNTLYIKVLFGLLSLFLVAAIYKYRTYKIRQHNFHLETEVSKRTIELIHVNKKLEVSAHTDYLTGLPNRKSFIKTFKNSLRERNLNSNHLFVVMADIDYFKNINDTYGHEAGDIALIELSHLIQAKLRTDEIIARWGGEEFLLCLIDTDIDNVKDFVEKIRKEVEDLEISYKSKKIRLSLTFGIAIYNSPMTVDHCIRDADNALYLGKNNGRNQVVVHK